jgi:hypothetical protein
VDETAHRDGEGDGSVTRIVIADESAKDACAADAYLSPRPDSSRGHAATKWSTLCVFQQTTLITKDKAVSSANHISLTDTISLVAI